MEVNVLAPNVAEMVKTINTTLTDCYQPLIDRRRQQLQNDCAQVTSLLDTLETTLDQADQNLQNQLNTWESQLQNAVQQAVSVATKVHEAIEATGDFLSEFQTNLQQIDTRFDEAYSTITERLDELSKQTQKRHEQALDNLNNWTAEIHGCLENLEGYRSTLTMEFTELRNQGIEHFDTVGQAFEKLQGQTAKHMADLQGRLDQSLQEMLNPFKQLWQNDIDDALNKQVENLQQVFDKVNDTGEQIDRMFGQSIGRILNQLEQVTRLLETIKPVLDLANKLV